MNKKQKKMLTRIVIAAAMLIALHFLPVTGLVRSSAMTFCARRGRAFSTDGFLMRIS